MTLPIILCDDDILLVAHYQQIIENAIMINDYDMKLVLATTDPNDIFLYLSNNKLTNSLFFLDIDLATTMTGIDAAQRIRTENEFAQIVFITSHHELALETLKRQIAPLDYIVKDPEIQNEKRQIENILNGRHESTFIDRSSNQRHLSFRIGSRCFRVAISSIYFIETSASPHKVILYGDNIMYEFYGKMNDLEKEYPELLRVHKSFLINPEKIKSIDFKNRIILFPEEYSCSFPLVKSKLLKKLS
ncbi:LytR/AlgR family response regulator transcription factor [Enterococcus sp. CSURQ0835]|uniref:LytR/AlgR family response regulator transcription factor n=1 Tax=Enterococcus sp. CSURQ0835 TaxID=2681394 RepID=UPI00135A165E|nr:LytTR family DNA-binding domain-containing protein [Enterococcus sp. CSURQ0835]